MVRDLGSAVVDVRVAAADAAANVIGDREDDDRVRVVAALSRVLDVDGSSPVRAAAALALADLGAHEALPALLVAADDDEPLVRQLAITALGEIGDPRARERVRRALEDERPEVRFQAVVAYPRLAKNAPEGRDEAWKALEKGLDDADAEVRGRAAEACGELADASELPVDVARKLALLADGDKQPVPVRVAAAIALAESRDRRGNRVLLDVLAGRLPNVDVGRSQAILELAGELGLEEALPHARSAAFGFRARFGDPGVRAAAMVALVRLGDERAVAHVMSELEAGSYARRMLAVGIAGRGALKAATARLKEMMDDPKKVDPEAVADALAKIAGEGAKDA